MWRTAVFSAIALVMLGSQDVRAIDPYLGNDPYWVLLHEPSVIDDLRLSEDQRQSYRNTLDELDLRFFPLRNKPDAEAGMAAILKDLQKPLKTTLKPDQLNRLNEILFQYLGTGALLRDDVKTRLRLNEAQHKRIREITDEVQKDVNKLIEKSNESASVESFNKRFREMKLDEQKRIIGLLKPDQQAALKSIYGAPFSLNELRKPEFKVPELIDTGEWINSQPLQLSRLRGKVVVVHFYACGCINCIHNYPSYRQWHERFKNQDVVLVGIHTPETKSERDSEHVRRRAAEEKLGFPILIDGQTENWNAWGNSMWPAVYVVDKRGYLRDFWPGELNWKGAEGEKQIRQRIEKLLEEGS